jgi:hypothetical protein
LGCFFEAKLKSFAGSANRCKQSQTDARIRKKMQEKGRESAVKFQENHCHIYFEAV